MVASRFWQLNPSCSWHTVQHHVDYGNSGALPLTDQVALGRKRDIHASKPWYLDWSSSTLHWREQKSPKKWKYCTAFGQFRVYVVRPLQCNHLFDTLRTRYECLYPKSNWRENWFWRAKKGRRPCAIHPHCEHCGLIHSRICLAITQYNLWLPRRPDYRTLLNCYPTMAHVQPSPCAMAFAKSKEGVVQATMTYTCTSCLHRQYELPGT